MLRNECCVGYWKAGYQSVLTFFKARAVESKPRERIEQAGTASVASGAELLAVILKTGSAG